MPGIAWGARFVKRRAACLPTAVVSGFGRALMAVDVREEATRLSVAYVAHVAYHWARARRRGGAADRPPKANRPRRLNAVHVGAGDLGRNDAQERTPAERGMQGRVREPSFSQRAQGCGPRAPTYVCCWPWLATILPHTRSVGRREWCDGQMPGKPTYRQSRASP